MSHSAYLAKYLRKGVRLKKQKKSSTCFTQPEVFGIIPLKTTLPLITLDTSHPMTVDQLLGYCGEIFKMDEQYGKVDFCIVTLLRIPVDKYTFICSQHNNKRIIIILVIILIR